MKYLFIVMDDERRAHTEYLDSAQAVCDAVKRAVFDYRDGREWDPDHIKEAEGITETLLEDGYFPFEGDPPLYLFQLPDGVGGTDTSRPVTVQEDRFLREAAKRASTLVAPGKLAPGVKVPRLLTGKEAAALSVANTEEHGDNPFSEWKLIQAVQRKFCAVNGLPEPGRNAGVVVDHGLHSRPVVDHEAANLRDNADGVQEVQRGD